jgi:hypothetical protein
VKVQNLTKSVLIALLIASPLVGAETQYPAADFQPEIIKQDAELIAKHAEAAKAAAASTPSQSQPAPATVAASTPAAKAAPEAAPTAVAGSPKTEESSNLTVLLALGAAAVAGFWFFRKPKSGVPAGTGVASAGITAPLAGNGETGVARYLKSLPETNGAKETGVARYIKSLPTAAPTPSKSVTGVEKYISALPEPAKAPMETGVAKYLKSQGLTG